MGFISSTRVVTVNKTLTRDELIELRDAIKDGRNYGALTVALASAIGFVPGAIWIAGMLFTIALGLAIAFVWGEGADDRCQTLLDQGKSTYNVNLKAEWYYETMQEYLDNEPTKVTYLDIIL